MVSAERFFPPWLRRLSTATRGGGDVPSVKVDASGGGASLGGSRGVEVGDAGREEGVGTVRHFGSGEEGGG